MDASSAEDGLIDIPLVDLGDRGPLALIDAAPGRFRAIFGAGLKHYGPWFLKAADGATERWLARADTPYAAEVEAVAARAPSPGARMLNLSYERSCTTGVGPSPAGGGNRMLRTLDWPLDGLGRNLVVTRHTGPAGPWVNVTWPGFVGVATAMAPGRFSAAINQPPMRRFTGGCWLDWAIERVRVSRRTGTPPMHLLRRVFEECRTFEDAQSMLTETEIAVPAFFSLSGARADQGCVIERMETRAFVRAGGRAAVANHWVAGGQGGRLRGHDSPGRLALMERTRDGVTGGFGWVDPPILNPTTRLAVVADAAAGALDVRGYERDGVVTRDFSLPRLAG